MMKEPFCLSGGVEVDKMSVDDVVNGSKKRILVIEDSPQHLADARQVLDSKEGVEAVYATTYRQARSILQQEPPVDGIITDIYFPYMDDEMYNQPEPIGVRVAVEAAKEGTPFVMCTAGYHHGKRYQWISELAWMQDWDFVEPAHHYDVEHDAPKKDWEQAYSTLEAKLR
ncbi:MAG: response regulator [Nanoarchaeota archaeon]